jgi:RHS repeat-associated protein
VGATFLSRILSPAAGIFLALALAFAILLLYLVSMSPNPANAQTGMSYTEFDTYYYTLDHIGRPFNLRDDDQDLRWFEHHYPFGEIIEEEALGDPMSAGSGNYTVTWKPSFRFPGQYEDDDQFPFVQNHFREYLPEYGIYSSIDKYNPYIYAYAMNMPYRYSDPFGLDIKCHCSAMSLSAVIDFLEFYSCGCKTGCCKKTGAYTKGEMEGVQLNYGLSLPVKYLIFDFTIASDNCEGLKPLGNLLVTLGAGVQVGHSSKSIGGMTVGGQDAIMGKSFGLDAGVGYGIGFHVPSKGFQLSCIPEMYPGYTNPGAGEGP